MAQIVVTVDDHDLVAGIRGLIVRGSDARPALERVADDFLAMERRAFATQGASNAEPWRPLSPEWARRKAGRGIIGGVLHGASGRLEKSLITRGARGSRRRISRQSVTMGSSHPLAHLHQRGTTARYARTWRGQPLAKPRYSGQLPARPMVVVGPRDVQRWRSIMADWLMTEARRLGL